MKFEITTNGDSGTIITINSSSSASNTNETVSGKERDNFGSDIITFDSITIILGKAVKGTLIIENRINKKLHVFYGPVNAEPICVNINSGTTKLSLEAGQYTFLIKAKQAAASDNSYQPSSYLKGHDIEKIYVAKNILEQNIQTPCSLLELSRKVGLNDFKLKKGFKELLGTTVFGYLFTLRMEHARSLLEQKRSVGEVAHEVGYKNPHHFTVAFKKRYALLPSDINR